MSRRATLRAKRLLTEAIPHVGPDVVVIAPGITGDGYLGTSLPTRSSQDIERVLKLVNEAQKKLQRWKRRREVEERRAAKMEVEA